MTTYANISRSEKELTVQIALFNRIHISDEQSTILASTNTHHGPILEHLASNSTCTNKEFLGIGDLFLEFTTKDCNLTIVTRASLDKKNKYKRLTALSDKNSLTGAHNSSLRFTLSGIDSRESMYMNWWIGLNLPLHA